MSLEFWVTTIVVTATPGTGVLYTIAGALAHGMRIGIVAAFGCTLAALPHMALALSGAAVMLAASPFAFEALKWLGVAYLLYLAWGTWRQTGALAPSTEEHETSARRVIGNAVLVNLLNPKPTLFFLVFLPMFVDPRAEGAVLRMAGMGLAFMAVTLVIFTAYAIGAAWLRRYVIEKPRVMRGIGRGFAICFVGLAGMLAITTPQ